MSRPAKQVRFVGAAVFSAACHAFFALAVLAIWRPIPPPIVEPQPVPVLMVAPPSPSLKAPSPQPAPTPEPARTATPERAPQHSLFHRAAPALASAVQAAPAAAAGPPGLSEAALAGATVAGGGGGSCDMAQRLEAAVRDYPPARAMAAQVGVKAVMIWNGDWVTMSGAKVKGLTAVRQVVVSEIAYSPLACRSQAMHGLVVLSVEGPEGKTRLALGQSEWRWTDLLTPHPGAGG